MSVDGRLTFEDGQVSLGGAALPGILVSQSVRGQVRFDEAEQDGLSGKTRMPMGWEDAEVVLVMDLLTDDASDCYDKLAKLDAVFRGADTKANPKVYDVANRHLLARSINRVLFSGLESSETDEDDVIRCSLAFVEHKPPVVRQEERVAAKDAKDAASVSTAPTVSAAEPSLAVDVIGG